MSDYQLNIDEKYYTEHDNILIAEKRLEISIFENNQIRLDILNKFSENKEHIVLTEKNSKQLVNFLNKNTTNIYPMPKRVLDE